MSLVNIIGNTGVVLLCLAAVATVLLFLIALFSSTHWIVATIASMLFLGGGLVGLAAILDA